MIDITIILTFRDVCPHTEMFNRRISKSVHIRISVLTMLHTEFTKSLSTNRNFRLIHKICSKWREVFWQNAIFLYHLTYTDFWKVCLYIDFFWKRKICLIRETIVNMLTYWLSRMFVPISNFFIGSAKFVKYGNF